jgi:hypothetical protein
MSEKQEVVSGKVLVQNKTARILQFAVPMNMTRLPDGSVQPTINDHRVIRPGLNQLDKGEFEKYFKPTSVFLYFKNRRELDVFDTKGGDLLGALDPDTACAQIAECFDVALLDEIDEGEKRKDIKKAIKAQRESMLALAAAGVKAESTTKAG